MSEKLGFSKAHFIGIGGAGMSGIALVLFERGYTVTGSDLKSSRYVRSLQREGIEVRLGHTAATIDEFLPDVVVVSSAIPETNPEYVRARELGISVIPRAKMLAELGRGAKTLAVAGTHGKTTTSSMLATMLDHMGYDPSFLIGGIVEEYKTNGRSGKGDYFVCEADESDGSFLFLNPNITVVTNIEADHLDHYGTLENLEQSFCKFMALTPQDGAVIVYGDDKRLLELAQSTGRRILSYGFDKGCDFVCTPCASTHHIESSFDVSSPQGEVFHIVLSANPGKHNMANASAALAVAYALDLDLAAAAQSISAFKGAYRRFTHVGDESGISVVDDYGHHPTEIAATLSAAKDLSFKRVICVFQPHRYSRTQNLADQFAEAFSAADTLFVMDVFSAGEMPIPGISGKTISSRVKRFGKPKEVFYVPNPSELIARLVTYCKPGDLVITQGAGDVTQMGPLLLSALHDQAQGS